MPRGADWRHRAKGSGHFSFSAAEFVKVRAGKGPRTPVPGEPFRAPRGEQTQLPWLLSPPTSEPGHGSRGHPSPQAPTLPHRPAQETIALPGELLPVLSRPRVCLSQGPRYKSHSLSLSFTEPQQTPARRPPQAVTVQGTPSCGRKGVSAGAHTGRLHTGPGPGPGRGRPPGGRGPETGTLPEGPQGAEAWGHGETWRPGSVARAAVGRKGETSGGSGRPRWVASHPKHWGP